MKELTKNFSGADDVEHAVKLFKKYFERYTKLEGNILIDGLS